MSLHHGPGWGSAELAGRGQDRRLRVSLPAGWLASVWACGLARVGRHLVVAVERPGWPDARVLGLRAPGAEPEPLDVQRPAPGMSHTGPYERESGGRGARGGGRGPGAGAAVGGARHRQDVRHPGHGPRHGPALRDGHRLDQGALRLRRAAHRGRRRGAVRSPGLGAAAGRGRARPAVPRRAVHRPARRAGRAAPGGAGTGRGRPHAAGRGRGGGRGQPARAGRGRLGPVRAAGQPAVPPVLAGPSPLGGRRPGGRLGGAGDPAAPRRLAGARRSWPAA